MEKNKEVPSWIERFDKLLERKWLEGKPVEWELDKEDRNMVKDFIRQIIISERKSAVEEEQSRIRDIIIDWEKDLGGLKTIDEDGGCNYVNLTYLLGKISKYDK